MSNVAELKLDGKTYSLPVVEGTEQERAVCVSALRDTTGYITLDDGYGNTGSCRSAITFIDGEKGILRYRGIPIEELAEQSTFIEVAHLLIMGKLPNREEMRRFSDLLTEHQMLHEDMKHHFEGFPSTAHPMAILSSMINASSCFDPELMHGWEQNHFDLQAARLLSQVRTIAAFSYRKSRGLAVHLSQAATTSTPQNFLHMMFSEPYEENDPNPEVGQRAGSDFPAPRRS